MQQAIKICANHLGPAHYHPFARGIALPLKEYLHKFSLQTGISVKLVSNNSTHLQFCRMLKCSS